MIDKLKVLQYMKEHGGITSARAFYDLGCSRLSGRIYDLKKDGIGIDKKMVSVQCRDGNYTRVAYYFLTGEDENDG